MVADLRKAGFDDLRFLAHLIGRRSKALPQIGQVIRADILEFDMPEMVPDASIGIQVGCIGGQTRQPGAGGGLVRQKRLDGLAAVNRCVIPKDQHLALDVLEQVLEKVLEKGDHRVAIERLLLQVR
jgi:hypothetical protein